MAVIIAVAVPVSVMAQSGECGCGTAPVVYVRGFGGALTKINEDGTKLDAFAFDEEILADVAGDIAIAVMALLFGGKNTFSSKADAIVDKFLGVLECTYGGDSIYNIVPEESDSTDIDKHKNYRADVTSEERTEAMYSFEYDWRLDPMSTADELNSYIEQVKAVTGHSKVIIECHSEGSCVLAAYLYKYGTSGIEKLCFVSAAVNGIDVVGKLFTKDVSLKNKGDDVYNYIYTLLSGSDTGKLISALVGILNDVGLLNYICNLLDDVLIETMLPSVYEKTLIDMFATMPALWSFVPDSYYENAKKVMFGENKKYALLVEKIDAYHYNVQNKLSEILKKAKSDGVDIIIISQYGFASIPVYDNCTAMGDMLVETKYSSFGATTTQIGNELELNMNSENSKYCSKDKLIDASSCLFPDYTWFVRGVNHANATGECEKLISWAILYDDQATVFSDESYPQFIFKSGEEFFPVSEAVKEDSSSNFIKLIKYIIGLSAA